MDVKEIYRRKDIALMFGVGLKQVDSWIKKGLLSIKTKGTRKGSPVFISGESVKLFLNGEAV